MRITLHDPSGTYTFAKNIGGNVINLLPGFAEHFRIGKRIIKSLSTTETPCYETLYFGKKSCIENEAINKFLDKSGCILPWMKLLKPKAELCTVQDQKYNEAFQEYLCNMNEISPQIYNETEFERLCHFKNELSEKCQNIRSCKEIEILKSGLGRTYRWNNNSQLNLKWENPRIMYVEEFVSYDFHNFIGEVGGFFGLFLGFSFTSLFVVFEWIQRKMKTRDKKMMI